MSHSELDIVLRELAEANTTITKDFLDSIEEQLSMYFEDSEDTSYNILTQEVVDFLMGDFDYYFLDQGISVNTYEGPEYQAASDSLKMIAEVTFQRNILWEALEELQQVIDMRSMEVQ